jgi:GalNAc-alpha-(1->4)-GalNAc-alpha-(1->3)-diNAcBac-PP-undecaprenol alpha-1,4-N-acetyl-D-galactosaminyltransferase
MADVADNPCRPHEISSAPATLDIACVIPSLRTGGSERVLSTLASLLSAEGHRIAIVTLMAPEEAPFYPLADSVDLISVGGLGAAASLGHPKNIGKAAWRIRRALKLREPGLILGFTTLGSMLALLASCGLQRPVIAAERIDPLGHSRRIGRVRTLIRNTLYARADHVVVQTLRARHALPWLPDDRISCIANPIHPIGGQARPAHPDQDGRFRLLGVGRLDRQKGFDLLISAFAQICLRFPDWDLVIHGEGPERPALELLARRAPAGRIRLPGVTSDIETTLLGAHVFAFPSRYEGFPNALAEAMAAGLAVLGFRDVSGVEDLIVTVPDGHATGLSIDPASPVDSIGRWLEQLLQKPELRTQLGATARQHVAAFTPQIHYERWERLLSRVARSDAYR